MKEIIYKVKTYIVNKSILALYELKNVGKALNRESNETIIASKILMNIIKRKDVTQEEIKFIKEQAIDLSKVIMLIGIQSVPGSSIALIAIEKVIEKHGLTLFPTEQKIK